MKKKNENNLPLHGTLPASACMDCLFWYRCRGGKLDCMFRTPMAQTGEIRA